jgi:hypothetical protein
MHQQFLEDLLYLKQAKYIDRKRGKDSQGGEKH